jgi:hypothetical protein
MTYLHLLNALLSPCELLLSTCRRVFEPFSGLHQAVTAARDATDPDKVVNMSRNGAPYLAGSQQVSQRYPTAASTPWSNLCAVDGHAECC